MMSCHRLWLLTALGICVIKWIDAQIPFECPKGWTENTYSGSCIKVFTDDNYWTTARVNCQKEGADLVKINSMRLNDFIAEEARKIAGGAYWIGLSDREVEGSWRWLDDTEEATFTNFDGRRGESGGSGGGGGSNKDCAELYVQSQRQDWRAESCTDKNPYVCEISSKEVLDMTCPAGWTKSVASGTCIWASSRQAGWNKARSICQTFGGDLAKILDSKSNRFISGYAYNIRGSTWIGLNDIGDDGEFTWLDDNSLLEFTAWRNSGPSGSGTCVVTGRRPDYFWDDESCRYRRAYLCEVQQSASSSCRSGWIEIKSTGSCVKAFDNSRIWVKARLDCIEEGADLLKVPNESFNEVITELISSVGDKSDYWIGLRQGEQDDKYRWLDESDEASYFNWYGGKPGTKYSTNCAYFDATYPDMWKPSACELTKYSICEYKPKEIDNSPCGREWTNIPETDKCIQLSEVRKDWESARKSCQRDGGDLLTITSEDQNLFVADLAELFSSNYWLGLHDANDDDEYSWLDDTAVASYLPWSAYSSPDAGKCATIGQAEYSKWRNYNCTLEKKYICEVSSKDKVNCSIGWTAHIPSKTCIKVFEDKVNWGKARRTCQKEGADLVKIWDPLMNAFITDEVDLAKGDAFWIGLHDTKREGDFVWVDGSTIYYNNWYKNQPNDLEIYGKDTGQDCVMIEKRRDFQWNDVDCSRNGSFICQRGEYKFDMSTTTGRTTPSTTQTTTSTTPTTPTTSTTTTTTTTTSTTTEMTIAKAISESAVSSTTSSKEGSGSQSRAAGDPTKSGGLSGGAVAAIVISVLVVCAVLAVVGWRYVSTKRAAFNVIVSDTLHFSNKTFSGDSQ